jgi:hypothetical protein
MQCDRCNQTIIRPSEYLPGYGTIDGQKLCYACCADVERESMLRFSVPHVRRSVHNLATWRYDFQFTGPDGKVWSGVNYGDNTQIARCKRLKKQPK